MTEAETGWYAEESATFGDRLEAAREAAGMDQAALARRLGVKIKTLRAWEDDASAPRANRLQMLAGVLNVSIMWLLNGTGDGLPAPDAVPDQRASATALLRELTSVRRQLQTQTTRLASLEKAFQKLLTENEG